MVRDAGAWHMFFEVFNRQAGKGEIGWAMSNDALRWEYQGIVLKEPFHLSYPYVFAWNDRWYMIPETHKAGSIRLYEAASFPAGWSLAATLASGHSFSDTSPFYHHGKWWLFTETDPQYRFDTLRLYHAENLRGPWSEHSRSPLITGDPHIARPAGRVIVDGERIIRFAQDCIPRYGTSVRAFEVTELTEESYSERPLVDSPVLAGSGMGWNACGMHHVDAHMVGENHWISCVDGWCLESPGTGAAAKANS